MQKTNTFRISIALEDEKTGGITLLVANEIPPNSLALDDDVEGAAGRDLLPSDMEGSLDCSVTTWLWIKAESMKQGAMWNRGTTKTGNPYWSSKPKITVIYVDHAGLLDGLDDAFTISPSWKGDRLTGTIDDRVSRVVVRDRYMPRPIEGL